ncbi:MAG: hypothetical protein ABUK01_12785 [Leptospirales bacterium]
MNSKTISIIAIFLWVATISIIGYRFIKGNAQQVESMEDTRMAITLTPDEKSHVLGEMRAMLNSIQGIVAGLDQGDMKMVSEAALESGTAHMVDTDPRLMMKLPLSFKKLGIGSHEYYDKISEVALADGSQKKILSMLNSQLQTCIACHDTFQFVTEP